jgi:hypothetical protein
VTGPRAAGVGRLQVAALALLVVALGAAGW